MGNPFTVGQSKVNSWRRCRQEYAYKYLEELQPKRTRRPFVFGKIIHRMIEAHAEGEDPFGVLDEISVENEPMFTAEKEMYGEIIEDIRTIMTDYFAYWAKDGNGPAQGRKLKLLPIEADENTDLRYTEHSFEIEIVPGVLWKGQIDALGTTDRLTWLVENKSFDRLPGDDHRWRNLQTVTYARAVVELGWVKQVDGVCWNYVMSKAPTVPQVLKDGSRLSAKGIITLPSVVLRVLREARLSVNAHAEILAHAENTRRDYFQRIFTPINAETARNIFDGFVDSAVEMRDTVDKKPQRNLGRHCEWCDYEAICRAELTGMDVDYVKEREFTHEDPEAYRREQRDKRKLPVVG